MDDVTHLEPRLAADALRVAGPSRPVDVDAVYTATITAARSSKRRFGSMFSAATFVVAGAVVALFGGFLLVGVLPSQPSVVPAGALPSATTNDDPTGPPGARHVDGGAIVFDVGTDHEETFPIFSYAQGIMLIGDQPWCRHAFRMVDPDTAVSAARLDDCLAWVEERPIREDRDAVVLPETWAVRVAMKAGLFDWPDPGPTGPPGSEYTGTLTGIFELDTDTASAVPVFWYGEPDLMFTADAVWCHSVLSILTVEVTSLRDCVSWVEDSPFTTGGNNVILPETWAVRIARMTGWLQDEDYDGGN